MRQTSYTADERPLEGQDQNAGSPRGTEVDPQAVDDPYLHYQIKVLIDELRYVQKLRNSAVWKFCERPSVQFIARHLQQFYWTLTRLCGMGHLHGNVFERDPGNRPVLVQENVNPTLSPRILIDVTPTYRCDVKTGIQRVVREVANAAIETGSGLPVVIENGRLVSYFQHPQLPDVISIQTGDHLLLLDGVWNLADEYIPILQAFTQAGGQVVSCVYDLVPVLYPGTVVIGNNEVYLEWLARSLPYCTSIVTISKSVAEDFINYLRTSDLPYRRSLRVGWFLLGADFKDSATAAPSESVQALSEGAPFFLTVGTLEPRKNHMVALDAFDLLWEAQVDVRYIIVGKLGWLADATHDRIVQHREFRRRLLWLDHTDDIDLCYLYKQATALIQPSIAEGFGLPIIEAAHYETPVIASDIRIFREVGGEMVSYFDPMDARSLVTRVQEALSGCGIHPSIPPMSWKEATATLLNLIRDETYLYDLGTEACTIEREPDRI